MCLTSITSRKLDTHNPGIGYKIFPGVMNQFYPLVGKTYGAKKTKVCHNRISYISGFHVYLNKNDAIKDRNEDIQFGQFSAFNTYKIYKVRYFKPRILGELGDRKIIIADAITILGVTRCRRKK